MTETNTTEDRALRDAPAPGEDAAVRALRPCFENSRKPLPTPWHVHHEEDVCLIAADGTMIVGNIFDGETAHVIVDAVNAAALRAAPAGRDAEPVLSSGQRREQDFARWWKLSIRNGTVPKRPENIAREAFYAARGDGKQPHGVAELLAVLPDAEKLRSIATFLDNDADEWDAEALPTDDNDEYKQWSKDKRTASTSLRLAAALKSAPAPTAATTAGPVAWRTAVAHRRFIYTDVESDIASWKFFQSDCVVEPLYAHPPAPEQPGETVREALVAARSFIATVHTITPYAIAPNTQKRIDRVLAQINRALSSAAPGGGTDGGTK